jgi:hypothetical protein
MASNWLIGRPARPAPCRGKVGKAIGSITVEREQPAGKILIEDFPNAEKECIPSLSCRHQGNAVKDLRTGDGCGE